MKNEIALIPISIHAPLAGSDLVVQKRAACRRYFNPRSPCGERPCTDTKKHKVQTFQSTLPLRGATFLPVHIVDPLLFQSTLPFQFIDVGEIGAAFQPELNDAGILAAGTIQSNG